MRVTLLPILLPLALAALLAGCGGSGDSTDGSDQRAATTGASADADKVPAQHLDGSVRIDGETLVLTPENRAPIRLQLGEEVAIAQVRALEASGAIARVTFEPATGDDHGVAIDVRATPQHQGAQTYTGVVTKVDAEQITIKGDGGVKTFAMGIDDAHEVEHLQEHADTGSPVKVFLGEAGSDAGPVVVAYEDA